ncbi:hypothetical protein B0J18DRAFT_228443 [Chaetomium sp. MPI-SDFR-AT-0129]|nr:hypothetical protein B0J18DRAFT_228443 [Chaetomium sp. MPI-SDFR-AT-0129]
MRANYPLRSVPVAVSSGGVVLLCAAPACSASHRPLEANQWTPSSLLLSFPHARPGAEVCAPAGWDDAESARSLENGSGHSELRERAKCFSRVPKVWADLDFRVCANSRWGISIPRDRVVDEGIGLFLDQVFLRSLARSISSLLLSLYNLLSQNSSCEI